MYLNHEQTALAGDSAGAGETEARVERVPCSCWRLCTAVVGTGRDTLEDTPRTSVITAITIVVYRTKSYTYDFCYAMGSPASSHPMPLINIVRQYFGNGRFSW